MTRVISIGIRREFVEEWEQIAERAREKFAEKVGDLDKRLKVLREVLEAIPNTVAASFAWRYASLNAVVVLNLYFLGILTGVIGFVLSADPLFLFVSIVALIASLILSAGFISGIFLLLFRALKRKS